MNYTDNERAIIWLDAIIALSREQKLKLINKTKSPAAIFNDVSVVEDCVGTVISEAQYGYIRAAKELNVDDDIIKQLNKENITAITCMSDGYPSRYLQTSEPPLILYCKGNIDLLSSKHTFAIVGSRKTLPQILSIAEEFSSELAKNDVTIVTGLAEGVDTAVINGALQTGNIISIIPGGFRHIYPEFNRNLFEKVTQKGLVITERTLATVPKPYLFPERNRLIAGLADGLLVCSAGQKSGTSYTADYANEYGKNVFAFPYSLGVPSGEGCNALIKEYAMLCDSVDDIFLSLGVVKKKPEKTVQLTEQEQKVFACIKQGEIHIDLLLQKTGMKIYEITPVLTMLEIKKYIIKNPGNTYSAIK